MEGTHEFFPAKIYKVGVIRYIDVPGRASAALGNGAARVPVCGTVDGIPLKTTMVSRGNRCYRLAIHSDIRKKLRIDTGAVVDVALCLDEESREPVLPPALVLALRNAPAAQHNFRAMTTALRRQIVRYLVAVKQAATLERRVTKLIRRLEQREAEKNIFRKPGIQPAIPPSSRRKTAAKKPAKGRAQQT